MIEALDSTGITPSTARPGPLVVVPCGSRKSQHRTVSGGMYLGAYHLSCRRAAAALTTPGRTLILSALHGLLQLDRVIEPYELRLGQPGSVSAEQLRAQARRLGVYQDVEVIVLAGRVYAAAARQVWPHAIAPLAGAGGLGHQRAVLARIARAGVLACR